MQAATPLTPCQKLRQAWTESNSASTPEVQKQKQLEMIELLREKILGFNSDDAKALRELANEVTRHPQVNAELVARINYLADRLNAPGELPNEMWLYALSFISPHCRFGMHCSNSVFGAESKRPAYRSNLVNEPDQPIPLKHLLPLLEKCGDSVKHLDFSRLLTLVDRQTLTSEQLERIVRLCPNLQSLTLYEVDRLKGEELQNIVRLAPRLTHLNVVCCFTLGYFTNSLVALQASDPLLNVGFIPSDDKFVVLDILERGIVLRHYMSLDAQAGVMNAYQLRAMRNLLMAGMDFEAFGSLKREQRARVLDKSKLMAALRGESLNTLLKLSDDELTYFSQHREGLHSMSSLDFSIFVKDSPLLKALREKADETGTVHNQELPANLTEIVDDAILERSVSLMDLPEEEMARQMQTERIVLLNEGLPLARFVQLQGAIRQKVMLHAKTLGAKIQAGLKLDEFLQMSEAKQDIILNGK